MLSKLLFYVLLIVLLSAAGYWFASGSGDMVLVWQDYELTMNTANFVFLMIVVIVIIAVIIPGFFGLFRLPKKWLKARDDRKFREGLSHVTGVLTSISIGDTKAASASLGKARKVYGGLPIVPLLETQIAAATKDQELLQKSLSELQHHKQTKALASKGLAEMHMRKGELISAIPFAEKAMELEPKNAQSFLITLSLYVKSKQYVYADGLVEDAKKQKIINKHEAREYAAMLAYLRSHQDSLSADESRAFVATAYELAPHKEHIVLRFMKLHNEGEHVQQAVKVLKRSWEGVFTPALYASARDLSLDAVAKKKLYTKLLSLSLEGKPYAHLLLASVAVEQDKNSDAIKHLERYAQWSDEPLDLTLLDKGYPEDTKQAISDMITHIDEQLPPLRWVCASCNKESDTWQVTCSACQSLDSFTLVKPQPAHVLN